MAGPCLDISDEQFKKLGTAQKLDVLYVNQKQTLSLLESFNGVKKYQKMQWYSISGLAAAIGWLFVELWMHIKG